MFRRHNGFRAERVWLLSKRLTLHTFSMCSAFDTVELDPVLKFDASGCIQWPNQILCVFWSWLKSSVKCRKRMRWFCRNGTWSWVPEENPAQPISPNPLLQSSRPAHTRCNFTCTPPSNLVVIIYTVQFSTTVTFYAWQLEMDANRASQPSTFKYHSEWQQQTDSILFFWYNYCTACRLHFGVRLITDIPTTTVLPVVTMM